MRTYRRRYNKSISKSKKRRRRRRGGSSKYSLSMFNIHPPVAYGNKSDIQPEPYFQSK